MASGSCYQQSKLVEDLVAFSVRNWETRLSWKRAMCLSIPDEMEVDEALELEENIVPRLSIGERDVNEALEIEENIVLGLSIAARGM